MKNEIINNFGVRIAAIIEAKLIDQTQFADAIGGERSSVSNWVRGATKPSKASIKKILEVFEVNKDWWETGQGEMFNQKSTQGQQAPPQFEFFIQQIKEKDETIATLQRTVNYVLSQLGVPLPGKPKGHDKSASHLKVEYNKGTVSGTSYALVG